jgi:hypothetical protein
VLGSASRPSPARPSRPTARRDEVKAAFWAIFELPDDALPGDEAVRNAQRNIDAFAARYEREFPTAVKCLLTDRQALTAYLRFPAGTGVASVTPT